MVKGLLIKLAFLICSLAVSLYFCLILSFLVYEFVPGALENYSIPNVRYLQLKRTFLSDPVLAMRVKPYLHQEAVIGEYYRTDTYLAPHIDPVEYAAHFDQDGFRPVLLQAHNIQAAVFGDSFVECGDRDSNTLPELLAQRLEVGVKNFGISWQGPLQYLEVFKMHGVKLKPQVVVFSFFEGNDIRDIGEFRKWQSGGGYYDFADQDVSLFDQFLKYQTDLFDIGDQFFKKYIREPIARLRGRHPGDLRRKITVHEFPNKRVVELLTYPLETRPVAELLASEDWMVLKGVLGEFRALSESINAKPLFLFIPSKSHIYLPFATEESGLDWKYQIENQESFIGNTQQAFLQLCTELGIGCLDLTSSFQESVRNGQLPFYQFDSHWNEHGRQMAADLIARHLEQSGMQFAPK